MNLINTRIAIIGMGYVGLPLAIEFQEFFRVKCFDINHERIAELKNNKDSTLEVDEDRLSSAKNISYTNDINDLNDSNCYIVTVPTPIDSNNKPDLTPLIKATQNIGSILCKGDIVIYESTVYPGTTENVCVPILETESNLKYNVDFYCGYSPERINPGDRNRSVKDIVKVTAGSNKSAAIFVDNLYSTIIDAGTYRADSIIVAEAAKIIENTQRDINIALINELSIIFNKIGIDTKAVLNAAETKWNFIRFEPGLVGGHCIGVDPYYLSYLAESIGCNPKMINSGRSINDGMSSYITNNLIKDLLSIDLKPNSTNILLMGITFKENCPDLRNTKVKDIADDLINIGCTVDVYDPWVTSLPDSFSKIQLVEWPSEKKYDVAIIAVPHRQFNSISIGKIKSILKNKHLIYDLKGIYKIQDSNFRL